MSTSDKLQLAEILDWLRVRIEAPDPLEPVRGRVPAWQRWKRLHEAVEVARSEEPLRRAVAFNLKAEVATLRAEIQSEVSSPPRWWTSSFSLRSTTPASKTE